VGILKSLTPSKDKDRSDVRQILKIGLVKCPVVRSCDIKELYH